MYKKLNFDIIDEYNNISKCIISLPENPEVFVEVDEKNEDFYIYSFFIKEYDLCEDFFNFPKINQIKLYNFNDFFIFSVSSAICHNESFKVIDTKTINKEYNFDSYYCINFIDRDYELGYIESKELVRRDFSVDSIVKFGDFKGINSINTTTIGLFENFYVIFDEFDTMFRFSDRTSKYIGNQKCFDDYFKIKSQTIINKLKQ